jgi:hypothetical protein
MRRNVLFIYVAAALLVGQIDEKTCEAGPIRYSWSGLLEARFAADDPWQVGPSGAPFDLDVFVSPTAADFFEVEVEFAAFDVVGARLAVDGDETD